VITIELSEAEFAALALDQTWLHAHDDGYYEGMGIE
jgi:hypothetical protein